MQRIKIGKQTEQSIVPKSIVRTNNSNEQEYVPPTDGSYPNRNEHIVGTAPYDP